ncbi:radical SAM protein [Streptomyces sp. NPDC053431]|uniref:radical SAM protein n=1 Tax=Streptomyces sp. NPDC053431 TaxID=3365703 RepID=UPI0037D4887A
METWKKGDLDRPTNITWDITYACPLRCSHCYSESGRRPSRHLSRSDIFTATDKIIAMRPQTVALAGGEPLLLPDIFAISERMNSAGIAVVIYTSGWALTQSMIEKAESSLFQINVSLDGPRAAIHDRVRGRQGSFNRAAEALSLLNRSSEQARKVGRDPLRFGIDCVVLKSTFYHMEEFLRDLIPKYPEISFLSFGAVVPSGLASRHEFIEEEGLTDSQFKAMGNGEKQMELRRLAPPSLRVFVTDNLSLQMHPDTMRQYEEFNSLQIEPDGEVRAIPIYEGTVGSILRDSPEILWRRCKSRWRDPFVVEALSGVQTMSQWAAATRSIDYHFGTEEVRARIERRAHRNRDWTQANHVTGQS